MSSTSIIVKNVSARLQAKDVLSNISFDLGAADHLLICGASGSGKTSLVKALIGKLFHNGEVSFYQEGQKISPSFRYVQQYYELKNRSNVSTFYYQQRFNSFDSNDALTVTEELSKTSDGEQVDAERIDEMLTAFELKERTASPLLHLSSGERKRFQLIKALLHQPDCLVLDEPFIGLDVQSRKKLKNYLDNLAASGTKCIIICDPAEIPSCINKALQLHEGKMLYLGTAEGMPIVPDEGDSIEVLTLPYAPTEAGYEVAVQMKNVSISYGDKKILDGLDWQVNKGDKWHLKGRNGAGKSTLLSLVTGDNPQAYANEIYLFDKKRGTGESIWDIKKKIGFVSPELQWYFDKSISCFDAVASGLFDTIGLFRTLSESQQQQVQQWLAFFELETDGRKLLNNLPAGKQRLALLARAMVKNPSMLILDEPCQGLDDHQKNRFIQMTDALCQSEERTLIYVTHHAADLPNCVDKVFELTAGKGYIHRYEEYLHTPVH